MTQPSDAAAHDSAAASVGRNDAAEQSTSAAHVSREDAKRKVIEMKELLQQHGSALGKDGSSSPGAMTDKDGNGAGGKTGAAGGTNEVRVEIEDGVETEPGQRPSEFASEMPDHLTYVSSCTLSME